MDETRSHAIEPAGRRLVGRIAAVFCRNKDGATAVEFGLVLAPFAMLLFAIIETALVFFTGQALQTAVTDAARLIMTGQAQSTTVPDGSGGTKKYGLGEFKLDVCSRFPVITNCTSSLMLDVRTYASFSAASVSTPTKVVDGKTEVDNAQLGTWTPGAAGDIVVVRAVIEYPVLIPILSFLGSNLDLKLANLGNGKRLIMGSAAFRNEPFPTVAP
jgi:Flp pilus assembly protein TadG